MLYDATSVDQVKSRQETEMTVSEHIGLEGDYFVCNAAHQLEFLSDSLPWNCSLPILYCRNASVQVDGRRGGVCVLGGGGQQKRRGSSVNSYHLRTIKLQAY